MAHLSLTPMGSVVNQLLAELPPSFDGVKNYMQSMSQDPTSFLNRVTLAHYDFSRRFARISLDAIVVVNVEISVGVPGIDTVRFLVAPGPSGFTEFGIFVTFDAATGKFKLRLYDVVFALRLNTPLLRAVDSAGNVKNDPSVDIALRGSFGIDNQLNVDIDGFDAIDLAPCMIGTTGIIISATGVKPAAGPDWLHFDELEVKLPPDFPTHPTLAMRNVNIGPHGITGSVAVEWQLQYDAAQRGNQSANYGLSGDAVGLLFGAFSFGMKSVSAVFERSIPKEFAVEGLLVIPALDGAPLDVTVHLSSEGAIDVNVKGLDSGSILTLSKQDLFDLKVNEIGFHRNAEETAVTVGGSLQLTNASVKDVIPKVGLSGFQVFKPSGGDWDFRFKGVTVEINKSINFFDVAQLDVKSIGFSKRGDWKTFTLSATASIAAIKASVTVDGLRIPWKIVNNTVSVGTLTLDGLGVKGQIPDTLAFDGYVKWGGAGAFEGKLAVHLIPSEIDIGAGFKVGKTPQCRYAFFTAFVNWPPPGIPIGSLPLYLTGAKGLIGVNMRPDADTITDYFPLSTRPPIGLDQPSKWRDACDFHALGLGVQIATVNPRILNLAALFTFVYPELLLLIEGHAFLLQLPEPGKEPPFHALMAFDLDEPSALINVSGKYEFLKGVIKADGMFEAYYGPKPSNPSQTTYRIALGEPQRPISAKVLQLWQSNSYFVIEPGHWQLGSGIGFPKKSYGFSFASVRFEAYAGGAGEIFWGPTQLNGHLRLSGAVGFRIFRKGFDLSLGADVIGRTPDWLIDAELWFGVKFNILWKKFKFGATIPFHWEKRRTPPIPELLHSIGLKHAAVDADSKPLVLQGTPPDTDPDQGLAPALVPDMEPDTYPTIAFNYPTKDVTGLPFAGNVTVIPKHKTGDHEFEARLEGADGRMGVEMSRKKLDGTTEWVAFEAAPPSSPTAANDDRAYLYGAWQAAEGGEGANVSLHLFARSPFEYGEAVHSSDERAAAGRDEVLVSGGTTFSVATQQSQVLAFIQGAAASLLPAAGSDQAATPAVEVPRFVDQPTCIADLRARNRTLPRRVDQYRVNDDPSFPHSGGSVAPGGALTPLPGLVAEECRNFLNTAVGFRGPDDVIALDQEDFGPPISGAADVYVGGFGEFPLFTHVISLGTCEVVEELDAPYPLRYLVWHCDRGIERESKKLFTQQRLRQGMLRIMLRHATKKLTIHYEELTGGDEKTPCADSLPCPPSFAAKRTGKSASWGPLWCQATYLKKPFDPANFWKQEQPLTPAHAVDLSQPGRVVITRADRAFNEVVFSLARSVRIYSICYVPDPTEELKQADTQLENFMNLTWPNRHAPGTTNGNSGGTWCGPGSGGVWGGAGGTGGGGGGGGIGPGGVVVGLVAPGPGSVELADQFYTALAPIVPGYLYRVTVRTSHRRIKQNPAGPVVREYRAYFKVSHPPSDLTPYIGATFPAPGTFPHYRAHELYLRTNRNYVHKLFGAERERVTCQLRQHGAPRATLPFRDDLDLSGATTQAALLAFAASTAPDRRGWAWGKANGHEPTREEAAWIETYNASVPADRQITPAMGLPDDVLWAYEANPVLWREQFGTASTTTIPSFDPAVDHTGAEVTGRWSTSGSLLHHARADSAAPNSFLLGSTEIDDRFEVSAWLRPVTDAATTGGRIGVVLVAADAEATPLGQYLAVQFNVAAQRVSLVQRTAGADPLVLADRPFALAKDRWTRVFVRVAIADGHVAVTVRQGTEQILTASTDLTTPKGKVGFLASPDYRGDFDSLEVLSLDRLDRLPLPDLPHSLVVRYDSPAGGPAFEMYKVDFTASRYLDLFDQLNSWDRTVWRVPCQPDATGTGCANVAGDVATRVTAWESANAGLLAALGQVSLFERRYTTRLCTLEELEDARQILRERRFDLDETFQSVATGLGFELSPRPERFEFFVSPNGKGVLVECPEPIDWTRIGALALVTAAGTSLTTQLLYSSDFTRAILYLPEANQALSPGVFRWTLGYLSSLPVHLQWLTGWLDHRREEYTLTLEIP